MPILEYSSYLCQRFQTLATMNRRFLYLLYGVAALALLYFDKVLTLVMSAFNYVATPIHNRGLILSIIGLILIITIEILRDRYPIPNPKREKRPITTTPLYSDQPTSDDKFGRDTSADLLIEKIFSTFNASQADKGSFVININESYGYGKTSFLQILNKQLEAQNQPYHIIDFRPWLCDNDQAIIKEFFTLLCIKLKEYGINDDMNQYLALLLEESSQFSPWWAKIPLSLFSKAIKPYTLKETHDKIRATLTSIDRPIIITIDDVDRLHEKELIAVLKLIRDTADFPNIFYILAADNAHLEVMLERQGIKQPHKFLQKFFNLDYLLPAHEAVPTQMLKQELEIILKRYGYNSDIISSTLMLYKQLPYLDKIFTNMRDVYRFLNAFTSTLDLLRINKNTGLINPFELFCLTIIKHLRIDVYKVLRDRNDELLEVIPYVNNFDSLFHLKDGINIEKILRNKNMHRNLDKDNNEVLTKKDLAKLQAEEEKLTLGDVLRQTHISHDKPVAYMLDLLFGRSDNKDERSICRCNVYFLYFSGKLESNKLSTAETIDIIKMPLEAYENTIDHLFKENKALSFSDNYIYAYRKSKITREEAMKKYYTYLRYQYKHNPNRNPRLSISFEEFINRSYDSYMTILGELYGRYIIDNEIGVKDRIQDKLRTYCQSENDLNMLGLAFYIFSSQLSHFCFGREFIEPMINFISNRLISEKMRNIHVMQIPYSTFATIKLFKDEFSTHDKWQAKFEEFICEDETRCKQWLGSMVDFYLNGVVEWNYRRHEAILGEHSNSGMELLDHIKQKFPDCAKAIEELKHLQQRSSLLDLTLHDSNYFLMAREVQKTSTSQFSP